jgi:hypothetical protein
MRDRSVILAFVLSLALLLVPVTAMANTVRLGWDRNTEADVAGYNVYRSTTPGTYTAASKVNATLIPHPSSGPVAYTDTTPANTTYYYVVRAVNQATLESVDSNQVTANPLPPGPPGGLHIDALTTVSLFVEGTKVAAGPVRDLLRYTLLVPRQTPPRDVRRMLSVTVE